MVWGEMDMGWIRGEGGDDHQQAIGERGQRAAEVADVPMERIPAGARNLAEMRLHNAGGLLVLRGKLRIAPVGRVDVMDALEVGAGGEEPIADGAAERIFRGEN